MEVKVFLITLYTVHELCYTQFNSKHKQMTNIHILLDISRQEGGGGGGSDRSSLHSILIAANKTISQVL